MKVKPLIIVIGIILLTSFNVFCQGTNIRGQVINYYYQQQMPMVSAKVDLFAFDQNRAQGYQWILLGSTITDTYGFYFFRGVPSGQYVIWVNQLKSYNIHVLPTDYRYSYQDIPQFIF